MKKNPGRKERRNLARFNRKAEGKLRHKINIAKTPYKRKSLLHKLRTAMGF